MDTQQETLFILRVFVSCYLVFMNFAFFDDLVASSVFDTLPVKTQHLINSFMSEPMETASVRGCISSEGATPKAVNMEVPAIVPKSLRSPRLKPTLVEEAPKPKKDKQKKMFLVRKSPRKH